MYFFSVLDHTATVYQEPVICVFTEVADSYSQIQTLRLKRKLFIFSGKKQVKCMFITQVVLEACD